MPIPAPTAYYKFNQTNPNATDDSSGNGFHFGATYITSMRYFGKFAMAIGGNFTSQPVAPLTQNNVTGTYSISGWFEQRSGWWGQLIQVRDVSDTFDVLKIHLPVNEPDGPNEIRAEIRDGNGIVATLVYAHTFPPNGFVHVALVVDQGVAKLYVNGVVQSTQALSGTGEVFGAAKYKFTINNRGVDDLGLWNGVALSDSEVATIAAGAVPISDLI